MYIKCWRLYSLVCLVCLVCLVQFKVRFKVRVNHYDLRDFSRSFACYVQCGLLDATLFMYIIYPTHPAS